MLQAYLASLPVIGIAVLPDIVFCWSLQLAVRFPSLVAS